MSSIPGSRQAFAPSTKSCSAAQERAAAEKQSYRQILKSSSLTGGSQAANIVIGIFRTKAMGVLLGPAGVGLAGVYGSVADLAVSIAGMGIGSSGVRQIAEAVATGDTERIAHTVKVLRRMSWILGVAGAILLAALSYPVSIITFSTPKRADGIALLSLAVIFRSVSGGQGALIQGMRRIADLAKMSVYAALLGTAITVPLVYVLREDGVVPSLIGTAALTIITSSWYSRKINVPPPSMAACDMKHEASRLLKLGFAFMASGLMTMGSAYVIRVIVRYELGFEATGLYQSAWTLGGLYVGFILQAMGADFYPRLTAVATDNPACNRLVNDQLQIGLLLAGPGAIATLTFAPFVMSVFYSSEFSAAVEVLRWVCLGAALRVIMWPLGFIILAKARQSIFFWTELAWTVLHLGAAWSLVRSVGMNGAGMAFFAAYVCHGALIYPIVRRLSGFCLSAQNIRACLLFIWLIAGVFSGFSVLPSVWATSLGAVATLASSVYSLRVIVRLTYFDSLPGSLQRLVAYAPAAHVRL